MIIDLILDRKDGDEYDAKKFYNQVAGYESSGNSFPISRAMDGGTESDIKRELCAYIDQNDYNPEIKNYINSVSWL